MTRPATAVRVGASVRSGHLLLAAGMLAVPLALSGCAAAPGHAAPARAAEQLLQDLALPRGAERVDQASRVPDPFQSDEPACLEVERARYWRVPDLSMDAAQAWFERHVPDGLRLSGTGSGGGRGGETMTEVVLDTDAHSPVPEGSRLVVQAAAAGSGSVVRAVAQIVPASGCGSVPRFGGLHGTAARAPSG